MFPESTEAKIGLVPSDVLNSNADTSLSEYFLNPFSSPFLDVYFKQLILYSVFQQY